MIKKLAATLLISFGIFFYADGQIHTNSILLGGQISYYSTHINYSGYPPDQKSTSAVFDISAGIALKENNVYGVNLTFSPSNNANSYNGINYVSTKANQYGLGVFDRKYRKLARDFYFFAEMGGQYLYSKQTTTDTSGVKLETARQSGGRIYVTPGLSYRILNKLYLEITIPDILNLQYTITKNETPAYNSKQSQFLFNSSLNSNGGLGFLGVGFHLIL
ncbi:MAG: hypothetical protein KGM98_04950 [Bacteroidota bacterium]|nr:hypothetical protein [Bacteroidota bacterium]